MKQISNEEKKLLQEFLFSGTMKSDELESIVKEMKKEKVLKQHPYKITLPTSASGRYMTYIIDSNTNQRIKITSTTENGMYEKLYKHYFPAKKDTLESIYPLWLEKRRNTNLSGRTIKRNCNRWDRYYNGNKIVKKDINNITVDDIENFLHNSIKEHDMTQNEFKK